MDSLQIFHKNMSKSAQIFTKIMHCSGTPLVRPFCIKKWPFKRGGLLPGVEINTLMFRFTLSSGLSRGGGLSSGWPLRKGSTVIIFTRKWNAKFENDHDKTFIKIKEGHQCLHRPIRL